MRRLKPEDRPDQVDDHPDHATHHEQQNHPPTAAVGRSPSRVGRGHPGFRFPTGNQRFNVVARADRLGVASGRRPAVVPANPFVGADGQGRWSSPLRELSRPHPGPMAEVCRSWGVFKKVR